MDGSGSIGNDNWQVMLQFIETVVNGLTIGPNNVQVSPMIC